MARTPKITNEEILTAARQIFLEQGVGASTLTIAEKAGISEASIFKRFVTKEGLFLAAMGINETPKWIKPLTHNEPTAEIKSELVEFSSQMLAFYQEVLPRVMMLMQRGQKSFPPPMPPFPPPFVRDTHLLTGFLERAIAKGYLRSCNATIVAHAIVGAIHNYLIVENVSKMPIPLPISKPQSIEPDIFIQSLIETIWTGIAPEN